MTAVPSTVRDLSPGDPAAHAAALAERFRDLHGRDPEGVYAAPGRVNLIGEHVDYNGGRCLPLTLPHACFVAVGPRDDDRLTLHSLQGGDDWAGPLSATGPGQVSGWVGYAAGVLWAMAQDGLAVGGLDLVVDGHVPLGAGLSSSAALECAVALAAAAVEGEGDDAALRERLVRACMRAENEVVGAPTGGLDQSAALLCSPGQALLVDFSTGERRGVPWHPEADGLALLVIDTGVQHALGDGDYGSRRDECEEVERLLDVSPLSQASLADVEGLPEVLGRRLRHVLTEIARVNETVAALGSGRMHDLGAIFTASHRSLRDDYEVSCTELDVVAEVAVATGAIGARMTGGGFGGSAIALVPVDRVEAVVEAVAAEFAVRGWAAPGVVRLAEATPAGRVL